MPQVNYIPIPNKYAYMTTEEDGMYFCELAFPISKEQFDAIANGEDLWAVLRRTDNAAD